MFTYYTSKSKFSFLFFKWQIHADLNSYSFHAGAERNAILFL